ncbi:MAG: ATP-binding protein [Chthoniobacterales bacterium]
MYRNFPLTPRLGSIRDSIEHSWRGASVGMLFLAIVYYSLGVFAFSMAVRNANVTCQAFFPEGISLACVILFGPRIAPGIIVGQCFLAIYTGLSPGVSLLIALCNCLQAVLGGHLFFRWNISPRLDTPRDITMLFVLCAMVVQPLSATGGVLSQWVFNVLPIDRIVPMWLYWWAGNVLGQMLVLPLVLSWASRGSEARNKVEIRRALITVGIYFVPVAIFVFGDWGENGPLLRLLIFAAFYLPLIWLAVQSRVSTIALANLLLTAPFLCLINAGPDLAIFFSIQNRHLCADILILAGIVTSLLLSALWDQLMARKQELREANLARERLFSVIGHDLNAPIATLKTALDLAVDEDLTREEYQELQGDLQRGVDQMHRTLKNLMEWGGQQMATLKPNTTESSIGESVTEAIQLMSLQAEEKNIEIAVDVPKEAFVRADVHQFQSILRNLLSNALKFTRPGGRITVSAEKQSDFWRISVKDSGVGMSREKAARLFEDGGVNSSTRGTSDERGLGLGLQLCYDFVQANGGSIVAEAKPDQGTTIAFTLPAA